jgi:hypothetical protein
MPQSADEAFFGDSSILRGKALLFSPKKLLSAWKEREAGYGIIKMSISIWT